MYSENNTQLFVRNVFKESNAMFQNILPVVFYKCANLMFIETKIVKRKLRSENETN